MFGGAPSAGLHNAFSGGWQVGKCSRRWVIRPKQQCSAHQRHATGAHCLRQEWVTPQPSRRPDIFPEFDKQSTPMPKPMPGDPEMPDEV